MSYKHWAQCLAHVSVHSVFIEWMSQRKNQWGESSGSSWAKGCDYKVEDTCGRPSTAYLLTLAVRSSLCPREALESTSNVILKVTWSWRKETLRRIGEKKQPKYSLTEEWINKMWCIHKTEYYSAVKRNEVLQYGWTLKTGCRVKSPTQRTTRINMIPFIWNIQNRWL